MQNIIAVFENRSYALQFASILKRMGIRSKTIDTPRELSVACGISVVFESFYWGSVKDTVGKFLPNARIKFYLTSGGISKKYVQVK